MEPRGASAYLRQRRDSNSSIVISSASATLLAVPSAMSLGPVWVWAWADPAATTINAVALTIGVVIGASTLKAKASKTE